MLERLQLLVVLAIVAGIFLCGMEKDAKYETDKGHAAAMSIRR